MTGSRETEQGLTELPYDPIEDLDRKDQMKYFAGAAISMLGLIFYNVR